MYLEVQLQLNLVYKIELAGAVLYYEHISVCLQNVDDHLPLLLTFDVVIDLRSRLKRYMQYPLVVSEHLEIRSRLRPLKRSHMLSSASCN